MHIEKKEKPPRGSNLDLQLEQELAAILSGGPGTPPITFSSFTSRLGLKSRSTLHTKSRKEKIRQAIALQEISIGATSSKSLRKTHADRILDLERQNAALQSALDQQIEQMCRVIANATAKGWDVDFLLRPLLPNNRQLAK
jgi:hypothetical protein